MPQPDPSAHRADETQFQPNPGPEKPVGSEWFRLIQVWLQTRRRGALCGFLGWMGVRTRRMQPPPLDGEPRCITVVVVLARAAGAFDELDRLSVQHHQSLAAAISESATLMTPSFLQRFCRLPQAVDMMRHVMHKGLDTLLDHNLGFRDSTSSSATATARRQADVESHAWLLVSLELDVTLVWAAEFPTTFTSSVIPASSLVWRALPGGLPVRS